MAFAYDNIRKPLQKGHFTMIFFFKENFNLWRSLLIIALYHHIKTPIGFWWRQRLNPRSLIQPSETLSVELTGTHNSDSICTSIEELLVIYYTGQTNLISNSSFRNDEA